MKPDPTKLDTCAEDWRLRYTVYCWLSLLLLQPLSSHLYSFLFFYPILFLSLICTLLPMRLFEFVQVFLSSSMALICGNNATRRSSESYFRVRLATSGSQVFHSIFHSLPIPHSAKLFHLRVQLLGIQFSILSPLYLLQQTPNWAGECRGMEKICREERRSLVVCEPYFK